MPWSDPAAMRAAVWDALRADRALGTPRCSSRAERRGAGVSGGLSAGHCAHRGNFDEMQHTRIQRIARVCGAADMNDGCVLQLVGEDVNDALERLIIKRAQRIINQRPTRRL